MAEKVTVITKHAEHGFSGDVEFITVDGDLQVRFGPHTNRSRHAFAAGHWLEVYDDLEVAK